MRKRDFVKRISTRVLAKATVYDKVDKSEKDVEIMVPYFGNKGIEYVKKKVIEYLPEYMVLVEVNSFSLNKVVFGVPAGEFFSTKNILSMEPLKESEVPSHE